MWNTRKKTGRAPDKYFSVAAAIEAQGLTRKQVCDLIGKDKSYVSKLVNRKARPSFEMAVRIERVLHVDIAALL